MPNPFKSRRVRKLPDAPQPSSFDLFGGFAEAPADPYMSPEERNTRTYIEPALQLAELDAEHRRERTEQRLAGVRRGRDYGGRA